MATQEEWRIQDGQGKYGTTYRQEDARKGDPEERGVKGSKKQYLVGIWQKKMSSIETHGGLDTGSGGIRELCDTARKKKKKLQLSLPLMRYP